MMDDEGEARLQATYGDNYARLAAVKKQIRSGQPLPGQPEHQAGRLMQRGLTRRLCCAGFGAAPLLCETPPLVVQGQLDRSGFAPVAPLRAERPVVYFRECSQFITAGFPLRLYSKSARFH